MSNRLPKEILILWFPDYISDGGACRRIFSASIGFEQPRVPVRVLSFRVPSDAFAREGVQCRGRSPDHPPVLSSVP
jgi:hypothetical protein